MSMVTTDMGLNMVKAAMDLNLASNLKYLPVQPDEDLAQGGTELESWRSGPTW